MYSGTLTAGSAVYNSTKGNTERIGRIVQMHANHRQDIDMVYAGDIAAAVGLKNTTTGDTLCDEKHPIILESMEFPGAGYPRCDRAEDEGRSGKDGHRACEARRRRPDLQGVHG